MGHFGDVLPSQSLVIPQPPQPFYSPFSGTTRVSRCQTRTSGLYSAMANTPTIRLGATPSGLTSAHLHHPPFFYRPDALPAAQPTASKHWRHSTEETKPNTTTVNIHPKHKKHKKLQPGLVNLYNLMHAQTAVWPLTHGYRLFWQITRFILTVEPYKLHHE